MVREGEFAAGTVGIRVWRSIWVGRGSGGWKSDMALQHDLVVCVSDDFADCGSFFVDDATVWLGDVEQGIEGIEFAEGVGHIIKTWFLMSMS